MLLTWPGLQIGYPTSNPIVSPSNDRLRGERQACQALSASNIIQRSTCSELQVSLECTHIAEETCKSVSFVPSL
jgi:hypothetical protein